MTFYRKLLRKSCKKVLGGIVTTFYFNFNMLDIYCQVFIFYIDNTTNYCTFDIFKIMCYNHRKGVEENGKKSYSSHEQ